MGVILIVKSYFLFFNLSNQSMTTRTPPTKAEEKIAKDVADGKVRR